MKFLSVLNARSIWLFDTSDLNPQGKYIFPANAQWLKEKYNFVKIPANIAEVNENGGLPFLGGSFTTKDGTVVSINEMTIYNDGIIVNGRSSTRHTDEFMEAALSGIAKEFDLPYSTAMIRIKQNLSEIRIQLDYPLTNINPQLLGFCNKLSSYRRDLPPFEFTGVNFAVDKTGIPSKPHDFSIERQINTPFSENRFYSKAPFHTDEHITLVAEFGAGFLAPATSAEQATGVPN